MKGSARWKRRPDGSTWGDWGEDDQLGRLNLVTPARRLRAASEIRTGRSFCLSLPLDLPGGNAVSPARHPPLLRPTMRADSGKPVFNYALHHDDPCHTDLICDDSVLLHLQYSTQWDSFAHVGQMFDADGDGVAEACYYNGYRAAEHIGPSGGEGRDAGPAHLGATALGIETMAASCMQGRGVIIDLGLRFGREKKAVGYQDLMAIIAEDGIDILPGDFVCIRTGLDDLILEHRGAIPGEVIHASCAGLDGRDERLLGWISDSHIAALISDNLAVETVPSRPAATAPAPFLPLHAHCLFKLGVALGELWRLSELAAWLRDNGRTGFFLTAPPLRLPGAVGSPATPVATV